MRILREKGVTVRQIIADPTQPTSPATVMNVTWDRVVKDRGVEMRHSGDIRKRLLEEWTKWMPFMWAEAGFDNIEAYRISCTGFVSYFYACLRGQTPPKIPKIMEMTPSKATKEIIRLINSFKPWVDITHEQVISPGDLIVCQNYAGIPVHSMIASTKPRHVWHCTEVGGCNETYMVFRPGDKLWKILRPTDKVQWVS